MVQSHDDDWLNILRRDFQLWTKKIYDHIHAHHTVKRYLAHHELTQDEIDCHFIDRIAVAQRLQPSPHLVDGMDIPLQDLFLQLL